MLKLRNYLDPKSFYKSSDFKKLPKFFQVGTVIDGNDTYSGSRIPKGSRTSNLTENFLKEDKELDFSKRKFAEI